MQEHRLQLPLSRDDMAALRAGDRVFLTGKIFAARDEAHKRLFDLIERGEELPADFQDVMIYYVGPAPAKPGQVINSAGPTTAKRMDAYTDKVLELGVQGLIGKGERGAETRQKLKGKAVYFAVLGGVAAKVAKSIKKQEVIAFEDAGMEALRLLEVQDFPAIVINDLQGNDAYEEGRRRKK